MIGNQGNTWDLENICDYVNITNSLSINYVTTLTSYDLLEKYSSLTSLSIYYTDVSDISFLENMTSLTSLTLNNNNISALKPLENLTSLKSLNLKNNAIVDTSSYYDENDSEVKYKNLQILADLFEKGSLRTLYLSGNGAITDYSLISGLGWTTKDF